MAKHPSHSNAINNWSVREERADQRLFFRFLCREEVEDFDKVLDLLQHRFGGRITNQVDGPCSSAVDMIIENAHIVLVHDSAYGIHLAANAADDEPVLARLVKQLQQALETYGRAS